MNELTMLRAMIRLARCGKMADLEELRLRVAGTRAELRATLRCLEGLGLVSRSSQECARLTLQGLVVGMAAMPPSAKRASRARTRAA